MKRKKRFSWLALLLALVLSFTSCAFPGLGGNARSQIVIAAGNTTERQILAYLIQGDDPKAYADQKLYHQ